MSEKSLAKYTNNNTKSSRVSTKSAKSSTNPKGKVVTFKDTPGKNSPEKEHRGKTLLIKLRIIKKKKKPTVEEKKVQKKKKQQKMIKIKTQLVVEVLTSITILTILGFYLYCLALNFTTIL